jgi:hypothetical protein
MKKILFSSIIIIGAMVLNQQANAQDMAFNPSGVIAINPYSETGNKMVSELDVNINAARDFKLNFKKATDVKWIQHDKGESVYFTHDGIKMRSSYNSRGRREYTLKYYDESRMPSELRQRVRSNYYDYNIVIVTEVLRNNQTYYLVKMENKNEYLTLKVNEEEMAVFEKTSKAR